MMAIAEGALARLDEKATRYRIFGHTYVLKSQIAQVAKVVEQLKGIIGEAVKVSPQASVAWAGICVVIPLLANPSAEDTANRDGFAYVANRMGYYTALEPLLYRLLHDSSAAMTADGGLAARCNRSIEGLYQHILEFQLRSIQHYYRHWLCSLARDMLPYDGWKQMQVKVKELEQVVSRDLSQINELSSRQELETLNNTADSSRQALRQALRIGKDHLRTTMEIRDLLSGKQQTEEERQAQECHQTFRLTRGGTEDDSYEWYKGRVEDRIEGTCEWFVKHDNFQSWLKRNGGPLFVSADPGCGKSVLAKYLIDHLLPSAGEVNICYFFFKDQDQNTLSQALCALLHQLFSQQPALIRHAMPKFAENGPKMVTNTRSLWDILKAATEDASAEPTTFVLDALDECVERDFRELMQRLTAFFVGEQVSSRKVKFLLTGRPYSTVVSGFQDLVNAFPYVRIPGENRSEAISMEVDHVIRHRVRKLRLSKHIEGYLEQRLASVKHRTYLWVYLVFDYLESEGFQKTKGGVDLMLQNLPITVNEAYEKILAKRRNSPMAQKTLSIILAASRPLTVAEMNVALSVNLPPGSRDNPDSCSLELESKDDFHETLRRVCGLFVSIYHDRVYFLHQTAREFLLATPPSAGHAAPPWMHSITMRQAHTVLAEVCVVYLGYFIPDSSLEELYGKARIDYEEQRYTHEDHDDQHPSLLGYSARYWATHFREAAVETNSVILADAVRICDDTSRIYSAWFYLYRTQEEHYMLPLSGLAIASRFGLENLVALLLAKGVDVNTVNLDNSTALHLAAHRGHKAVAELLIIRGADVNSVDHRDRTPLYKAARSGHEAVTELLIIRGADVNSVDHYGDMPLHMAARGGHEAVTELLIIRGADVNSVDHHGRTPLYKAAGGGHEAVTELLIIRGADVNSVDHHGRTPLHMAARSGHEAVTELLINRGADVDSVAYGLTPLCSAVSHGYIAVAELLIIAGADVNVLVNNGATALHIAAGEGHEAITELLIIRGADVNSVDSNGYTPLDTALSFGSGTVAKLLKMSGAVLGRVPLDLLLTIESNGWVC
jgi:ankyrin repeat protein